MDKTIKLSLMLSFLFLFSSHATAADSSFSRSGEKLAIGVSNVATGIIELPKNVILKSEQEGVFYGVTVGLAAGIMHTVSRTVMGMLDVVTFIIPTNSSVYPPFVWQEFSRETTYSDEAI
jgi:putative exosortase-associated protein (TIGR04073 family)